MITASIKNKMYTGHQGNCQICGDFDILIYGYCLECLTLEEAKLIESEKI